MSLPTHLTLEIVTPDRALVTEDVDEVQLPGTEGYLGILPGHTPLLTSLRVGQVWYRKGGEKFYLSVAFGFAEVLPDRVRLLARIAERAEEIDITRAEEHKRKAEEALQAARAPGHVRGGRDHGGPRPTAVGANRGGPRDWHARGRLRQTRGTASSPRERSKRE